MARSRAGSLHHGEHVVHPGLQVRDAQGPVGHPGPALVEPDESPHVAEPLQEQRVARVLPVHLQVRDESGDQHDVGVTTARHLVGDVQPVAERVAHWCAGFRWQPGAVGRCSRPARLADAAHKR